MLTLIAILLAIFWLPEPWGLVAIVVGGLIDILEVIVFRWWSRKKKARVGVQMLVGKTAVALGAIAPRGQVRVDGEIWEARSESPVSRGDEVVVGAVEGLTLLVEPPGQE
ncbi:MAG TPA: NfeD family protein [Gaiellaceae bacterium]|nr:NfeD family protein [Gaiellaceae bacterium]